MKVEEGLCVVKPRDNTVMSRKIEDNENEKCLRLRIMWTAKLLDGLGLAKAT